MKKQPLKKSQRTDLKSLYIGLIGGAYVVVADKLGTLLGMLFAQKYGMDPTLAGTMCSILLALVVIGSSVVLFRKVDKK